MRGEDDTPLPSPLPAPAFCKPARYIVKYRFALLKVPIYSFKSLDIRFVLIKYRHAEKTPGADRHRRHPQGTGQPGPAADPWLAQGAWRVFRRPGASAGFRRL